MCFDVVDQLTLYKVFFFHIQTTYTIWTLLSFMSWIYIFVTYCACICLDNSSFIKIERWMPKKMIPSTTSSTGITWKLLLIYEREFFVAFSYFIEEDDFEKQFQMWRFPFIQKECVIQWIQWCLKTHFSSLNNFWITSACWI